MPSIAFTHAGLWVNDLPKMKAFYTGMLGFYASDGGKTRDGGEICFLTHAANEHHQVVLASGRPSEVSFNVIQQISFLVDSLATLRRLHAGLKDEPVTQISPITHGNAVSIYFRDPENNRTELYIHTPWHIPQPYGKPIDFALPDAELWQTVEEHARSQPGFMPRVEWERDLAQRMERAKSTSRFWQLARQ